MTIRSAQEIDAAAIAALTVELGYAGEEAVVRERLRRLATPGDQRVLVAEIGGEIAGWIQAHASEVLESGFRVEIVGLVVGQRFRRRGVGRALVERAEAWATELGAATIVVRSNVTRTESHVFYPALGYAVTKTQAVYRKPLRSARAT